MANILSSLICLGLVCQLSASAAARADDAMPAPLAAVAERLGCDRNAGAHALGFVPGRPAEQSAVLYCAAAGESSGHRDMRGPETVPARVIIVGIGADGEARALDSFAPLHSPPRSPHRKVNVEVTDDLDAVLDVRNFGYAHPSAKSVADPLRKQLSGHSNIVALRGRHYMATAEGKWLVYDAKAMPSPLADLVQRLKCVNPRPSFAFGLLPGLPADRSAALYCLSGSGTEHAGWRSPDRRPRDGDIVTVSIDDEGRAVVLDRVLLERPSGLYGEYKIKIFEPQPVEIVTAHWAVDAIRRLGHEQAPVSKALGGMLSRDTNVISIAGWHYMATREGKWLERKASMHSWLAESAITIDSALPDDLAALARQLACMHFDKDALQDDFVAYSNGILPGDERASAVFYCRKWIEWHPGMELVVAARNPDGRATLLDIVYLNLDRKKPLPAIGIDARADADAIARSGKALMPASQKLQSRLQDAASNVVTMGSLSYVIAGGRWHRMTAPDGSNTQ